MFDEKYAENRTDYNKKYVTNLKSKVVLYDDDPNIEERKAKHLCRVCFYMRSNSWAGQAFTDKNCEGCNVKMTFATTNTDSFCNTCAEKYGVCKHCGAKMD